MASDQLKLQEKKKKVKLMHVLVHVSPLLLLGLMALDHHGLVATSRHPISKPDAAERRGSVSADEQAQVAVFSVADVCKVLALDDFLHDVVGIHASVVHPGGVTLHRVLLPPRRPIWG